MESGSLVTAEGPGMFYLPKNESLNMIVTVKSVVKKGGVVLDGPYATRLHYIDVPCEICKECKKIIVSYETGTKQ
jgi:hypothetical protein